MKHRVLILCTFTATLLGFLASFLTFALIPGPATTTAAAARAAISKQLPIAWSTCKTESECRKVLDGFLPPPPPQKHKTFTEPRPACEASAQAARETCATAMENYW